MVLLPIFWHLMSERSMTVLNDQDFHNICKTVTIFTVTAVQQNLPTIKRVMYIHSNKTVLPDTVKRPPWLKGQLKQPIIGSHRNCHSWREAAALATTLHDKEEGGTLGANQSPPSVNHFGDGNLTCTQTTMALLGQRQKKRWATNTYRTVSARQSGSTISISLYLFGISLLKTGSHVMHREHG